MGHGVAIPHTKYPDVPQTTGIVAVSQGGVDFASLDGEPVYVFFCWFLRPRRLTTMSGHWKKWPGWFAMDVLSVRAAGGRGPGD